MKKILFFLCFLALASLMRAQEVAISYEIVPQGDNQASLLLYLQSMTEQDKAVRAINFSLALPEGCVDVTGQKAVFSDAWTDFLQEVDMTEGLDLSYANWHYSRRWQYGSADPGMPNTTAIMAPAQGKEPLFVMEISLEGSCTDQVYLEHQSENPINQMGGGDIRPINWTIVHPNTELELNEGLRLNIYPNPVQNDLHVKFEGQRDQAYHFELYSIDGKRLYSRIWSLDEGNAWALPMTELPAAVYHLSISSPDTEGTIPLQVKILKK